MIELVNINVTIYELLLSLWYVRNIQKSPESENNFAIKLGTVSELTVGKTGVITGKGVTFPEK